MPQLSSTAHGALPAPAASTGVLARRPARRGCCVTRATSGPSPRRDVGKRGIPIAATKLLTTETAPISNTPPPPCPKSNPDVNVWPNGEARPLEISNVFCNRSLNMKALKCIGFDMDYTLSLYKPETFEVLAHSRTVSKLVEVFGYPEELYDLQFDHRYMVRGLIIDKQRGNIIKVDRHKYAKIAYHGFSELTREQRHKTYNNVTYRDPFDGANYAMIDTLFSLAEAYLFMQLVELKDSGNYPILSEKDYSTIYKDTRAAVDLCHRDGSLKRAVAENPEKYIHRDPMLVDMLKLLRDAGFKLFLATNSLWDYTNVVMNFIVSDLEGEKKTDEWLELFDVCMVGCGKPGFFHPGKPLFEVHTATGMLHNTDSGAPIIPIDQEDLPDLTAAASTAGSIQTGSGVKARVFQGGTHVDLHAMLDVSAGSEVLYVGDHIYGDILRSKKSVGWRTMLVVPELETELRIAAERRMCTLELRALRRQIDQLEDDIDRMSHALVHDSDLTEQEASEMKEMVSNLSAQRNDVRGRHEELLKEHHAAFHPIWGQLTKTGYQNSRFAHQVERFACLYTSHVSNLALYSPYRSYRGRMDVLSHEEDPLLVCHIDEQSLWD